MKVSIAEARRRLPELVRRVRYDQDGRVQITVRDAVVAEIRPVQPTPPARPPARGRPPPPSAGGRFVASGRTACPGRSLFLPGSRFRAPLGTVPRYGLSFSAAVDLGLVKSEPPGLPHRRSKVSGVVEVANGGCNRRLRRRELDAGHLPVHRSQILYTGGRGELLTGTAGHCFQFFRR